MSISYTSVNFLQEPASIQQRFLPYDPPSLESVEYNARCRQAEAVGGDFYDFMIAPNGKLNISVGDICGKGLAAALLMANLQATLRAEVRHVTGDLSGLITTINRLFHGASLEHL